MRVLHFVPTGGQLGSADGACARRSTPQDGPVGGAGIGVGQSTGVRVMSTTFDSRPIGSAGLARPSVGSTGSTDRVTDTLLKPHVLIVEDDRDTREVVKLILEMEGIAAIEAGDGVEGLERLHELRARDPRLPCAIILDIMMPRCSGVEFRRRQLADVMIAEVPIIVLSAVVDQPRVDTLDAFAKLSKPFDPDHLIRAVRRACGLQEP
jgi:CheY-like chemotaxis protein